ncbi:hypothetical protein FDG94_gp078 [Pseudomonas phage SM1]|uniref:Uncharacterized protein n=1 Tax=Pseudomonas phage SM1 TaxID=1772332 RepID=A0A0U3CKE2_9CAUD|nr:hypothetical protein FDG94_gp078 [Pseudomonas phage SM1]ALT58070.1 hypothetical protein SM1_078 [Pseudomonas phage SM1]
MITILGPLAVMVVTVCTPENGCATATSKVVPLVECEARKEMVLSGADGRRPLRYDKSVSIECRRVQHGN